MRQDEGNKLFFSKLAAHLRSTGLDICMHKAKAHRRTHTHRGSTNQTGAMQLQLTNATTTSLAKKRPIPSSKTNFGTALFILLSQSRDGNGNGSRSGNANGNQSAHSTRRFDVSLSLPLSACLSYCRSACGSFLLVSLLLQLGNVVLHIYYTHKTFAH